MQLVWILAPRLPEPKGGAQADACATATQRPMDALTAYVAAGGIRPGAAELVRTRPSTVKRHLADLRARFGSDHYAAALRRTGFRLDLVPRLEPS